MKNLNNTIFFLTIITGTILLSSCEQEDYLEEESRSQVTSDMLFDSPEGVSYFMNGLYAEVYIERDRGFEISVEGEQIMNAQMQCGVDNCATHAHDGSDFISPLGEWNLVLSSWGHNRRTFQWIFRVINAANTVITRVGESDINWSEDEKNQVLAEARAIRAWAYRHATYLWGEVPLIDTENANVKTDWERTDLSTLYEFMENDLLFAETHLKKFHDHPGKISRAVATHYLAELYLRMERWEDAIAAANRIIDDPDYSLITERYGVRANEPGVPFMDQFYDGNVKRNEGNTEVLWAWIYEPDVIYEKRGSYMNRYWYHRLYQVPFMGPQAKAQYGAQALSRYAITNYGFDVYEVQDDRYSEHALTHYFIALKRGIDVRSGEVYSEGDTVWTTRFKENLPASKKQQPTNESRDFMWTSTRKWEHQLESYALTTSGWTYGDQPYLRLAETYLIRAEAEFRLNRLDDAAETLNIIRRRSNATEISTGEISLEFILDERSRELIGEEQRRYTLLRTATWVDRYKQYNPLHPETVQPHHALYPIPQNVIDSNVDLEMQNNPGYE